jgi:hypothetical protein
MTSTPSARNFAALAVTARVADSVRAETRWEILTVHLLLQ